MHQKLYLYILRLLEKVWLQSESFKWLQSSFASLCLFLRFVQKSKYSFFSSNGNYWVDNKTYGWNVFLFPFKRNFNINHKAGVQCENDHGEVPQQMLLFHQIISCKHNFKVKYLLNIWAITYISDWSNGMLEMMIDDVRSQHNDNHPFRLPNIYVEASQLIWLSRTPPHYAHTLPFSNELSLTWAFFSFLLLSSQAP